MWRLPSMGWAEKPRRAECAHDCEGIPETPALGGGVRSRVLCRCGRYGQLWGWYRSSLEGPGISVMEVERPKRRHLRRNGKSDPIDAEAAARAVLAGEAVGEPKSGDGRVEMIRTLRSARQSAVKGRSQAANPLQALLVTAPEDLRHRLRDLPTKDLLPACARFRPGNDLGDVQTATKFAL